MRKRPCIISTPPEQEYYFREGSHILEICNQPALDPALSIARARLEPGRHTRWHALRGVTERYLILEGQGEVEVGEEPPQGVAAGDVVLIPPGCRQRISNTGRVDLIFLALCTPCFTLACYEDLEPLSQEPQS